MLKAYDIQCEKCNEVTEVFMECENGVILYEFPDCKKCGGKTKRTYSKFNFKLVYDNKTQICGWSNNGYATNKYWDAVNKQRQLGNDVKPIK